MQQRMTSAAMLVPDAYQALMALGKSAKSGKLPARTALLVELRASQINGCGFCVDMHARELKRSGDTDERISAVAAWRDTPYFTEAERAALALTEAATRIADRPDAVTDEIWNEAKRHYDEQAIASLIIEIGLINIWNRFNVIVRLVAGAVPK
jgi:AhpD family alkylhydroperoxidase